MTKVFLKYNPFTVETSITINGDSLSEMSKLHKYRNERLQMWLNFFIPTLVEECNDDLEITFQCTRLDYEDVCLAIEEFKNKNSNVSVSVDHIEAKTSGDRLKELVSLFEYMQNECPFDDLRSAQIKENFYSAIGSEFEVSVIATMSSGKSTLINSMIGIELMPAKNEACTATIARIKDIDGKTNFSAICRNNENKEIIRIDDLTLETMNEFNNNELVSYIDIEGEIPFITSKSVQLVLLDTPGPNNSRTEDHKNHTYRIIKEKSKPMVLYVLNATQLSTNDDNFLLSSVAEAMKVGGKQAKDRFIFAVNKIDTFDTEKGESVEGAIKNVGEYLLAHGIENPNIYPISAEMAKVLRLSKNGIEISKKQRQTKENYWAFNEDKQMHLSKYAPLSIKNREVINEMINNAKHNGDVYEEALIHTGIPAIEIAINEYLDKYAITTKLKTAVDTFKKKIEEKKLIGNLLDELSNNEKAREDLKQRLKFVEQQLNDGKKAKQFKDKIGKIDMKSEADTRVQKIRAKITKALPPLSSTDNSKMSPLEVEQFMMKLMRDVSNLESDVRTDLERIVEDVVVNNANAIVNEYEIHIQSLITDNSMSLGEFQTNTTVKILSSDMPDISQLINKHKHTESVKTGEEYIENSSKKWYNPFTWFQESGHYKSIYEDRQYVDRQKVYDDFVRPISGNFMENIDKAKNIAYIEAGSFKKFFLEEIEKLNDTLKSKVSELQAISNNEKSLAEKIKENKNKKKWLEEFLIKLDLILEI